MIGITELFTFYLERAPRQIILTPPAQFLCVFSYTSYTWSVNNIVVIKLYIQIDRMI